MWDPAQYLKFGDLRLRPGLDLAARIDLDRPETIVDLGCGPGTLTRLLRARWPTARITGLDAAPEMLAQARGDGIEWVRADIATWRPPAPVDLLVANAALHWLDDHRTLMPRLFGHLAPGGVLAVQMPNNYAEPSHRELAAAARDGPWRRHLEPILREWPLLPVPAYRDLLAGAARLDIWETIYHQVLDGPDPVLNWVRGSALRPLTGALEPDQAAAFERAYAGRLAAAYPTDGAGRVAFPFRRLFMVAKAPG